MASNAQGREFQDRWRRVNDFTREEARRQSVADRLRGFFEMVRTTKAMGWQTSTPEENEEVARRWNRLREAHHGKKGA